MRIALDRYPADRSSRAAIDAMTIAKQPCDHLPMSNVHVRLAAGEAMINALRRHHLRVGSTSQVRTFLVTATFDDGLIAVDAAEVPLYRIERKFRWALNRIGLQGICAFDIDVLRRPDGEKARLLLVHVHAVCWTRDPNFSARAAERSLKALRRFRNRLGVPSFTIRSRAESAARHRFSLRDGRQDQTEESMMYLGQYLMKPCLVLKKRYRRRDGKIVIQTCEKGFGPKMVFLLATVWSGTSAYDAVFAVGPEGTAVGANYSKELRAWAKRRHILRSGQRVDVAARWLRFFWREPKLGLVPKIAANRPPG